MKPCKLRSITAYITRSYSTEQSRTESYRIRPQVSLMPTMGRNKTMLQLGDKVRVMFPASDQASAETVKKYQDKVTIIKNIHIHKKGKSSQGRTYILAGCKSDWGIDYEFVEDWLIPIDEGVEE